MKIGKHCEKYGKFRKKTKTNIEKWEKKENVRKNHNKIALISKYR